MNESSPLTDRTEEKSINPTYLKFTHNVEWSFLLYFSKFETACAKKNKAKEIQ